MSFEDGALPIACPVEPPLVEGDMDALSKDGLTMLFFAHVARQGSPGQHPGPKEEAKVLVDSGDTHCYAAEAFVSKL